MRMTCNLDTCARVVDLPARARVWRRCACGTSCASESRAMAVGSAFYKNYYLGLGLIYVIVGMIPVGQLSVLATCKSICPLKFGDRKWKAWACDLKKVGWDAPEGYAHAWTSYDNRTCVICEADSGTTLIQPCFPCQQVKDPVPSSTYSPSTKCTLDTVSDCSTATPANFRPADLSTLGTRSFDQRDFAFSPELDISLRGIVSPLAEMVAVIYVIQGLGCMIAGSGSGRFAGIYEDDWLKMKSVDKMVGCLVKFFPAINRCLNFFQFFMLVLLFFAIYVLETCEDAIDEYSEKRFFPFMKMWLVIALLVFLLCCIGGNIARAQHQKDPAFIVPLPDVKYREGGGWCGWIPKAVAWTKFYCIRWCGRFGGP